jgi:hypothetical protein
MEEMAFLIHTRTSEDPLTSKAFAERMLTFHLENILGKSCRNSAADQDANFSVPLSFSYLGQSFPAI